MGVGRLFSDELATPRLHLSGTVELSLSGTTRINDLRNVNISLVRLAWSPNCTQKTYRRRNNRRRTRRRRTGGPTTAPRTTLRRTFRSFATIQLDNTTGTGLNQYAYHSAYLAPKPEEAFGFKDAQTTFEFWRLNRFRIRIQPGYNDYNQSYNTINLDALAAMQIWTAADWSFNETISGVSIMSYNNAKCHTLSLNGIKTVASTQCRINQKDMTPKTILSPKQWLDTSQDMTGSSNEYSGVQLFARMDGMNATSYIPRLQVIFEYDVEFKQPAYQNRPTAFESDIVGASLTTIPDGSTPEVTREYTVDYYSINSTGSSYHLVRADGEPGTLTYTQEEFWDVYTQRKSGKYFSDSPADYVGPEPRKPYAT